MKKRIISSLLLMTLMLAACGGQSVNETQDNIGTPVSAADDTAVTEEISQVKYPAEFRDFGGYEFTFLNQSDEFWTGSHHILDYDELTGDSVEDSIYMRNRQAENDLNIKIKVVKQELADMYGTVEKAVAAGDDIYDAVYFSINWSGHTSYGTGLY